MCYANVKANFSVVEYPQAPDPEIERLEQRRVIDQLSRSIASSAE